ncbi:MAG: glycerophosphodiester phosphodiesterase family protein, partial [Candidatus Sericytochromatia bacterium]
MLIPSLLTALLSLPAAEVPHPLVIGHRGASGLLPEHTLEAYSLALDQGADYIEPDVVVTRDGYLIARHENEIGGTTDVAEKFPERKRTQTIDGQSISGWFSEDFTLAELRRLRARQRLSFRSQEHNDRYVIPTLDEILELVARKSQESGRPLGVYIETKHPSHFDKISLPIEPRLLKTLRSHQLDRVWAPVFIESFEVGNLQRLKRISELRLIQLIEDIGQPADQFGTGLSYASMLTPAGLQQVASYADGIGPYKRLIVPEQNGKLQAPTMLVQNAHAAGLLVHPWTFRSDKEYLAPEYDKDPEQEYLQF